MFVGCNKISSDAKLLACVSLATLAIQLNSARTLFIFSPAIGAKAASFLNQHTEAASDLQDVHVFFSFMDSLRLNNLVIDSG